MTLTTRLAGLVASAALILTTSSAPALEASSPDVIFKKSRVWTMLTPDDVKGMFGLAEETSDVSLACRQIGPIKFREKFEQGAVVLRQSRSFFFKKLQIVRGCDTKRNVLVYLVYSDKLIEGSPANSTSAVPIMPWGPANDVPRCADSLG